VVDTLRQRELGQHDPFTIDAEESELIDSVLRAEAADSRKISLAETLAIAVLNNREYQRRKEDLYIQALSLTETIKEYDRVDLSASLTARTRDSGGGGTGDVEEFGDRVTLSGAVGATSRALASGARVTLGLTQDWLVYTTEQGFSSLNSGLTFNLAQPLLNGFGPLVSREPLRQAERNMLYAVRDFKRYQQSFVLSIASDYYSLLQGQVQMDNERGNYESAVVNRMQSEEFAKAGRIPEFEVAQARQRELTAADRWTLAQATYQKQLDDFRFRLGLPITLNVEADRREFDLLTERGLIELGVDLEDSIDFAVSNRLDIVSLRDKVEDRERKLEIAERDFLPNLDMNYSATKGLGAGDGDTDLSQNLSVRLDLPFDWTEKRNRFRVAEISLDRERRALEEKDQEIRLDVRDLWRKLERSRRVYKNRLLSVELAERQVESTTMLLKLGRAQTRDQLEAQDDLLSAQNAVSTALVDYTMNRLRFWNAIERFEVNAKGMWNEQSE
jgi:outer membrane protein TolC